MISDCSAWTWRMCPLIHPTLNQNYQLKTCFTITYHSQTPHLHGTVIAAVRWYSWTSHSPSGLNRKRLGKRDVGPFGLDLRCTKGLNKQRQTLAKLKDGVHQTTLNHCPIISFHHDSFCFFSSRNSENSLLSSSAIRQATWLDLQEDKWATVMCVASEVSRIPLSLPLEGGCVSVTVQ